MRISFALGVLAALTAGGTLTYSTAHAVPVGSAGGMRPATDNLSLVENVDYVWNGQNYCWYDTGWKGPGWYVCQYGPWVSGLWWGGGHGWHNWHWHGGHGHVHHHHGGGGHHHHGHVHHQDRKSVV